VTGSATWDLTGGGDVPAAWQQGYIVDDRAVARAFGINVPSRHSDLLDIAMAAYMADRRTRRCAPAGKRDRFGLCWSRSLHVRIPVREPDFWNRPPVLATLVELLGWLTDDAWRLEFAPRPAPRRPAETQGHLFTSPVRQPAAAALFSGGLDSLAGAAVELTRGSIQELILVTVRTNSRMGQAQRHLLRKLHGRCPGRLRSVIVPLGLVGAPNPNRQEPTQRTRGLVFLVVGFVTAAAAGLRELRLYENGIGAINLPYSAAQVGTKSSRGAHPATLSRAAELFSMIDGEPFRVVDVHLEQTKAELCAAIPSAFHDLIADTFSCDTAFTRRVRGSTACGACTSCLLRRQSLWAAGMGHLDRQTAYQWDPFQEQAHERHLYTLHAMLLQVARLERCLRSVDPWRALVRAFPAVVHIPGAGNWEAAGVAAALRLLGTYVEEWRRVPSRLVSRYLPHDVRVGLAHV